jgi:hypothetical protein
MCNLKRSSELRLNNEVMEVHLGSQIHFLSLPSRSWLLAAHFPSASLKSYVR